VTIDIYQAFLRFVSHPSFNRRINFIENGQAIMGSLHGRLKREESLTEKREKRGFEVRERPLGHYI